MKIFKNDIKPVEVKQIFPNSKIELAINNGNKWIEPEGPVAISYNNGTLYIRSKNLRIEVTNV